MKQVFDWLVKGGDDADVLDAIARAWPEADPKPLVLAALRLLAEAGLQPAHVIHGWCLQATRQLYSKMLDVADFDGALKAVKQLHQLSRSAPRPAGPTGRQARLPARRVKVKVKEMLD